MNRFFMAGTIALMVAATGVVAQPAGAEVQRLSESSLFLKFRPDLLQTVKGFGVGTYYIPGEQSEAQALVVGKVNLTFHGSGNRNTVSKAFTLGAIEVLKLSVGGKNLVLERCAVESVDRNSATLNCLVVKDILFGPPYFGFERVPLIRFVGNPYNAFTQSPALFSTAYPVQMVVTKDLAGLLKNRPGNLVLPEGYFLGTANGFVNDIWPAQNF
jgi:hypothetical protein